jgi:16S rRNA (cytosine1402-N4)-methyltransferase
MALRMAVNDELGNLSALLRKAPEHLHPGGRFGVISFHSTEDRLVKLAFRSLEQTGHASLVTKKPITPTDEETRRNPRSRSAKLRVIQRN